MTYTWEPLTESHYPAKFVVQKEGDSGDMFLVCHVILPDDIIKGSCYFMGKSSSR